MKHPLLHLYKALDFQSGSLLPASEQPRPSITLTDWLEKGEWLAAAKRAGADSVFFVDNNPVAVFAECGSDHVEKAKKFNCIWSLARPRLLFLASPGEISVLDLAQKPINIAETGIDGEMGALAVLRGIVNVAESLQEFHRDNIESGRVFEDVRFGDLKNRADKALIRDLKIVRGKLIEAGLSGAAMKYAHALIGRSIFIRYLEDRCILTKEYFSNVARQTAGWTDILKGKSLFPGMDLSEYPAYYPRVLRDKAFTYALFRALTRDFNGDMFPDIEEEERTVEQKHLNLIEDLLYGKVGQQHLFFYSYRFDIIPLDLISAIYEEFYHPTPTSTRGIPDSEKKTRLRQDGVYYTPPVLAEFVLSRTLTSEELARSPRILDPACGSGIFLVEAFRRIVRYKWHTEGNRPTFESLVAILRDQIAGIEINEEAARITAFSLYLAMLHYLEPPSITAQMKQGNTLPNLLVTESRSKNHYHCIWSGNAFDCATIDSHHLLSNRFRMNSFDVVVGNPPWGAPGNKADKAVKEREQLMLDYCNSNGLPIGDKETSQAFLWRALDFLKAGGKAGMLVSAGVLFKHSTTTRVFREKWMRDIRLKEVFNFTHVRLLFFKSAISPFLAVTFEKQQQDHTPVLYWSAKELSILKQTQAVLFSKYDVHILRDEELVSGQLWKTYWFGRMADRQFIKALQSRPKLRDHIDGASSGRGYQLASRAHGADKLKGQKALLKINSRYDLLEFTVPPDGVERFGALNAYHGLRVLVNEGISENQEPQGVIIAQISDEDFCFYRSIYGIKLLGQESWAHKVLLGVLWSSLARYYFFMTSANWGLWHHKLLFDELLQFPFTLKKDDEATREIISLVDRLRNYHPQVCDIFNLAGTPRNEIEYRRRAWEGQLDQAVFEFYGLTEEQRDLVRDCCQVTIPFFYRPNDSIGRLPAVADDKYVWLENYAKTFARRWNPYLQSDEEMRAEVHLGAGSNMIAFEFFPADKADPWDLHPRRDSWKHVLEQIGDTLINPLGSSQILLGGVVHFVSSRAIVIIKQNQRRFWTRSLAREDADATLCKRMVEVKDGAQ